MTVSQHINHQSLDEYPEILNAKMIAQYLGIGYVKALNLLKAGVMPCVRIGNAYKVPKKSFTNWLNEPGLRKVL